MKGQWCMRACLHAVACLLVVSPVMAGDAAFSLSTGVEYTSGNYGTADDIEDLYIPVTATMGYGRLGLRVTLPYLSIRAPTGAIVTDPGSQPVPGFGVRATESGLGDMVTSVTLFDVASSSKSDIAMDLTGKMKLATADETRGLGTGENDYSLQADIYKFFDQFTLLASGGYKVRGEPAGIDLENVLFGNLGGIFRVSDAAQLGLFYDYRESSLAHRDALLEVALYISLRLSSDWKVQVYGLSGLSDSSPDRAAGMSIKWYFGQR